MFLPTTDLKAMICVLLLLLDLADITQVPISGKIYPGIQLAMGFEKCNGQHSSHWE